MNLDPEELKKFEEVKRVVLKKILTKNAIERLGRIKLVKPEVATQLEIYLVQLYQTGKLNKEITDAQLKLILDNLSTKQKFRILK